MESTSFAVHRVAVRFSLFATRYSLFAQYHFAGTSVGVFWAARGFAVSLVSLGLSRLAKAAETCAVRRFQNSICTSALAPASACVDLVCDLCGVSRLRQPPRSTDLPGSPIGS